MSGGRCSTTEAVNLLLPAADEVRDDYAAPMAAAAKLEQAIHEGGCDPRCKGVAVRPDLIRRLIVVVKPEKDGGWRARIENTSFSSDQPVDKWTFAIDEIMELRQKAEAAQSRRRDPPGKKPKDEWPEDVKAAVALKVRDDPKILRKPNYDALNREIRADFDKAKRWLPNDRKETEKIIHEFIQRLRDLNPP
jgi:hypothetical protein